MSWWIVVKSEESLVTDYPDLNTLYPDSARDIAPTIPISLRPSPNYNVDVCKTLMPTSPTYKEYAWPSTLTFDLLTWISQGVIYSLRTFYLPCLKLLGQSVLELSVAQGEVDWHDLWPWPTDLNINRGHLLIKDYLPTKFEASGAKCSWVISCTRWSRLAWPLTYWPEYQ